MADLIEDIGRTVDVYKRLHLGPTGIEVSIEADAEIKRLLRKRPEQQLVMFSVDGMLFPYTVNPVMLGPKAFKIATRLGLTPPELAIRRHYANRSDGVPQSVLDLYPKLKRS